uniref:Uncharacterized protein n=1 Tax=Sphaerodactylus townsendi TaxID=933632 RepID=A0ACB8G435_9SAUR
MSSVGLSEYLRLKPGHEMEARSFSPERETFVASAAERTRSTNPGKAKKKTGGAKSSAAKTTAKTSGAGETGAQEHAQSAADAKKRRLQNDGSFAPSQGAPLEENSTADSSSLPRATEQSCLSEGGTDDRLLFFPCVPPVQAPRIAETREVHSPYRKPDCLLLSWDEAPLKPFGRVPFSRQIDQSFGCKRI